MIETVLKLDRDQWAAYSGPAHTAVFGKILPVELQRVDHAYLVISRDGKPMVYVTCQERDAESLYWQYGGAFPETRGTVASLEATEAILKECKKAYKRVSFLVENKNTAMLKMAMKLGFEIVGIRNFENSILLEHLLEFKKET